MNILIHWKEDFSVKIKELDQQHKKLFDLINLLYDSYMRKENDEMLAQILADLKEYAFVHFKEEEKYFSHAELIGYKEVPNHILEHQLFIKSVEKFQAKYQSYGSAITEEILFFLQEWITTHILRTDKKYQNYLKIDS